MGIRRQSKIAELRKKAGLTQAALAALVGVTPNTIQNWERDGRIGQLERCAKLCEILDCQIFDLIGYVEISDKEVQSLKTFSLEQLRQLKEHWKAELEEESKPTNKRRRGVVLTEHGLAKLQEAKEYAEYIEKRGNRFTLEELSERTTLAVETVTKVFAAEVPVDKATLKIMFRAFNLSLDSPDYGHPPT